MRLINKERQSGKTTGLIYTSEATGFPILTKTSQSAKSISETAKRMGCVIPDPMTVSDYKMYGNCIGQMPRNVLIDEIETILDDAIEEYVHGHVVAATITLPMSTTQKEDAE